MNHLLVKALFVSLLLSIAVRPNVQTGGKMLKTMALVPEKIEKKHQFNKNQNLKKN